jgi:hypothetical protein
MAQEEKQVMLQLTYAEALVLFEWLTRTDGSGSLPIEDPAEQQVLWKLEGSLERTLVEPLAANYQELVAEARRKVRESTG